jgi:hypothetical protein
MYTIHTLVYDPTTLDLSTVVFGETTGFDVNALLIQGGGTICAALDVAGAEFQVADCTPVCSAFAGTLIADQTDAVCLVDGSALISATPNGDAVVPAGYVVAYVLTRGAELLIQNIEPDPSFEWPLTGEYTIHTLVYDPNTLDLSGVEFDVTTGFDINALLIQGGGAICASLDVAGAQFTIIDCPPACTAGVDADTVVCFTDQPFALFSLLGPGACLDGTWIDPAGQEVSGAFNPALDLSGTYMYIIPVINAPIDTAIVVLDVVECPGISQPTPIKDGAMESTGSATSVIDLASNLNILPWPNPAVDVVNINLPFSPGQRMRLELIDELGRTSIAAVTFSGHVLQLDVRSLAPGAWSLRIVDGEHTAMARFVHTQR